MKIDKIVEPYIVEHGKHFRLKDYRPADTLDLGSALKPKSKELLAKGVAELSRLQDILYAQDRWGVLIIFQAMDAAGKDGTIKHVMSGVNPEGVQVHSFKAPSAEELDHDYLWRCMKLLPRRGSISIFNRSYYEEVLVVRVHKNLLAAEKLPKQFVTKNIWKERFEDINCVEHYLARNGFIIMKFFLHLSRKEQKRRFLDRLDQPDKNWKFSAADAREREYWDTYQEAYEDMIRHTATPHAPWYCVPADNKWFSRLVVSAAIVEKLRSLDLKYPKIDGAQRVELQEARKVLESE
jgi:PPK2 family polyphosphate:nucleotide phosphotransferase